MGSSPAWRTKSVEKINLSSGMSEQRNQDQKKSQTEKFHTLALLSYIPLACFITFFSFDKLDEYSKKHAKQGIILLIMEIIALLFLIDFVSKLFWILFLRLCIGLSLLGAIKVVMKQDFEIPFVGEIIKKYDL